MKYVKTKTEISGCIDKNMVIGNNKKQIQT